VNKTDLVEALAARLGSDKKSAGKAIDGVLKIIYANVAKGNRVSITGFGAFEKRVRPAHKARNPATGEPVRVKRTAVPVFKAGAEFRAYVDGSRKVTPVQKAAAKKAPARKAPARKAAARKAPARKAPARKAAARRQPARQSSGRR
jgi:DNA-binding protein HU-beta